MLKPNPFIFNIKHVLFFLFGLSTFIYSQKQADSLKPKDLREIYERSKFNKKKKFDADKDKKVLFSLLPAPIQEGSNFKLAISFVTSFYLGDKKDTKLSEVSFAPTFSFSNQYIFPIRSYIYTKGNKFNFTGDYRYMIYPQPTYGLGSNQLDDSQSILDYQQWRFYQFVSTRISTNFYLGLGAQLDRYQNISEVSNIEGPTDFYTYMEGDYSDETSNGVAFQALFDSRDNILNATKGLYIETDFRINSKSFGSEREWKSIYFDFRQYQSLSSNKRSIIASRVFYWATFDGKPNYLDLPSIGWDRYGKTGRGFTRNRFRSNALLYFESEYRMSLTKNDLLGAVFFGNISSVSNLGTYSFQNWQPAIGTGLRLKWSKNNNNNLTADFGLSKNDWSINFGIAENF